MNKVIKAVALYCKSGSSDKEYRLQITEIDDAVYNVDFMYGRRGQALKCGTKNKIPLGIEAAEKIYNSILKEKLTDSPPYIAVSESYYGVMGTAPVVQASNESIFIPHLLKPIDEDAVEAFLKDNLYCMQEKMDGKHVTMEFSNHRLVVRNKKGKSIGFNEDIENYFDFPCFIDCEQIGDKFYVFDMMAFNGDSLHQHSYPNRIKLLNKYFDVPSPFKVLPVASGYMEKSRMYKRLLKDGKEGVVFKKVNADYEPGARNLSMVKFKFYSTLTAMVCDEGRGGKRSVGLKLHGDGEWINVGNVSIPINHEVPKPGDCVEIKYLYAYKGGSLFQPIYLGKRDDCDGSDCGLHQVKYKSEE